MIKPDGIPIAPLNNLVQSLEINAKPLGDLGQSFVDVGHTVHRTFGGLSTCYHAPEQSLLINSTQKVESNLVEFGNSLPALSGELLRLARESRDRLEKLKKLRTEALDWHRRKNGNPDWQKDQSMIDQNNRMVDDVHRIMKEEFPNLCFDVANAIQRQHGGKLWDPKTGLREGEKPKEQPQQEGDPPEEPWGSHEERDKPWWQDTLAFVGNALVGVVQVLGRDRRRSADADPGAAGDRLDPARQRMGREESVGLEAARPGSPRGKPGRASVSWPSIWSSRPRS